MGGTIVEKCEDKFYNTCTVWSPKGEIVTKFRKVRDFFTPLIYLVMFY